MLYKLNSQVNVAIQSPEVSKMAMKPLPALLQKHLPGGFTLMCPCQTVFVRERIILSRDLLILSAVLFCFIKALCYSISCLHLLVIHRIYLFIFTTYYTRLMALCPGMPA